MLVWSAKGHLVKHHQENNLAQATSHHHPVTCQEQENQKSGQQLVGGSKSGAHLAASSSPFAVATLPPERWIPLPSYVGAKSRASSATVPQNAKSSISTSTSTTHTPPPIDQLGQHSTPHKQVLKQHQQQQADKQQQQQQQIQSEAARQLITFNLTQLILDRFGYVFEGQKEETWLELTKIQAAVNKSLSEELASANESQFSPLETRSNLADSSSSSSASLRSSGPERKFFRVHDRVFSRVELPESAFRRRSSSRQGVQQEQSGDNGQCAPHIGCINDLPNFPTLLRLKMNVSASFTIYTRDGPKSGSRIAFEPLIHHQLEQQDNGKEVAASEWEIHQQLANSLREAERLTNQLDLAFGSLSKQVGASIGVNTVHKLRRNRNTGSSSSSSSSSASGSSFTNSGRVKVHRKRQETSQTSSGRPLGGSELATSAKSWLSAMRIARSEELPFDMAAIEQARFNGSQETRVIIGGYFAKEDEEWIEELVRQWLLLEPNGNVIKVSWQEANRGLYHTAAHNSRIVGRQLSLFLHYLDQIYGINLDKFHLVGHSLGAHIAGFVGADNEGQIARITGLDPAGPIFIELNASMRLDASDAKLVDVLHTNGGTITKGALGLSTPLGHIDYYCNGGSLQPGCYFSSVTKSIMDPVERIACNHRRSYRYFTELIRLAVHQKERAPTRSGRPSLAAFPKAFLFGEPKQEADLARLVNPDLTVMRQLGPSGRLSHSLSGETPLQRDSQAELGAHPGPQLSRRIEFHLMQPEMPTLAGRNQQRGLYFFKTRSEAPFFASRQYALTLRLSQQVRRKMVLFVKLNSTLVAELELDELRSGGNSFLFVPADSKLIDHRAIAEGRLRAPDLWLMWRQRSFNLLLSHHQNELQMSSIELTLMDNYLDWADTLDESHDQLDPDAQQSGRPTRGGDLEPESELGDEQERGLAEVGALSNERLEQLGQTDGRPAAEQQQHKSQSVADGRSVRQVFTIRYGPTLAPQTRDQDHADLAVLLAAHQAGPNSSSSTRPIWQEHSSVPIVLLRNQWHKFADGRAVLLEGQTVA